MTDHLTEPERLAWMRAFRNARRANALTQEKLAELSQVDVRTIQRVETEGRGSSASFVAIASVLGGTPESLLNAIMNTSFVLAIMNEKGGVGRTTLCWNLAGYLASIGNRVLMIQAARSGELYKTWLERPLALPSIDCCIAPTPGSIDAVLASSKTYDVVLIDGTRYCADMNCAIANRANRILTPLRTSMIDVWGTERFFKELQALPLCPPILAALNDDVEDGEDNSYMLSAILERLHAFEKTYGIAVARTRISRREALTRCFGRIAMHSRVVDGGVTVHDLPSDEDRNVAASQLEELWGEVIEIGTAVSIRSA